MSATLPLLSTRSLRPEVMDQPGLDRRTHRHALRGLARLNWWSGSSRPFRPGLMELGRSLGGRTMELLDVASGGGDVPVALASSFVRRGIAVRLTLCDVNPRSVGWALERARNAGIEAEGLVLDVTTRELPTSFDAVISSLFLHHLPGRAAVEALERMAGAARRLLMVCDLARTGPGLALAAGASRVLTRSPVVHTDAVLSVRAAFTSGEARELARSAGLRGAMVERCWPQRWRMTWWRP